MRHIFMEIINVFSIFFYKNLIKLVRLIQKTEGWNDTMVSLFSVAVRLA